MSKKAKSPRNNLVKRTPGPRVPATPKFELVTEADAETEQLVNLNVKTMRLGVNGYRRSEALLYAYAVIVGATANRLAEIIPGNGGLEKLLAARFPDLSKSQLHVWRHLATDVTPHLAGSPVAGLLTAPVIGKGNAIPAKKLEGFQAAIKKVLRGSTMEEFHRASQFCGEVAAAGGDRGGSRGNPISDEDAAELLRESVRSNARDAAALMEDQKGLVRLMDNMEEFGKIRMIYYDLNHTMVDMSKKFNVAHAQKRGAAWAGRGEPRTNPLDTEGGAKEQSAPLSSSGHQHKEVL
jgi:hypothetical protein